MTSSLARPPLSPNGLRKRPTYRTKANKKLQKEIYYFIVFILLLNIFKLYSFSLIVLYFIVCVIWQILYILE
jgi:hypothetical protein